jgi:hypothetical protein
MPVAVPTWRGLPSLHLVPPPPLQAVYISLRYGIKTTPRTMVWWMLKAMATAMKGWPWMKLVVPV